MRYFILLFILFSISTASCKKDNNTNEVFFKELEINSMIYIPPFPRNNMKILSNRSFVITSSSPGDSTYNFIAYQDTITGFVSQSDMDTLVFKSKKADVYNIKFSNSVNDSIRCNIVGDFAYTIKVTSDDNKSNTLSFNFCFIPKESLELESYSRYLLAKYLKRNN